MLIVIVWLGYALTFPLVFALTGIGAAALAIFPAGITAWLTGPLGGAIGGAAAFVVNTILLMTVGRQLDPLVVIDNGGAVGSVALLVMTAGIGFLSQLKQSLERRNAELTYLARHDVLTGLLNRHALTTELTSLLATGAYSTSQVAVLFIDVDDFKQVNELYGHDVGDAVLRTVAKRITGCVRRHDPIGRMGGDEFIVVLPDITAAAQVELVAHKLLAALKPAVRIGTIDLQIGISIGISLSPHDGSGAGELLSQAVMAMDRTKENGRNHYTWYTPALHERFEQEANLARDLGQALLRDELLLHYHPQVDVARNRVVGFEALLRWQHPTKGMIPPGVFIPVAERSGLIRPLGDWVLQEACRQLATWTERGFSVRMAVNVSPAQLSEPQFVDRVLKTLADHQLEAWLLELEITETYLMRDVEAAVTALGKLRHAGVRIALDDFGTGYSSLSYLHRLPITSLKIDRSLVSVIPGNHPEQMESEVVRIVRAVITMAHALEKTVIAEGVETPEQLELLKELGAEYAQGFLFCKPLPAEDATQFLQQDEKTSDIASGSRSPPPS